MGGLKIDKYRHKGRNRKIFSLECDRCKEIFGDFLFPEDVPVAKLGRWRCRICASPAAKLVYTDFHFVIMTNRGGKRRSA